MTSKQLRDDLMTMLIAGHETTAAVLTWTLYCLACSPSHMADIQAEVDAALGDQHPGKGPFNPCLIGGMGTCCFSG